MSFSELDRRHRPWMAMTLSLWLAACSDERAPGQPPPPPEPAEPALVCGDHRVDPGEQCDDGNSIDGDGCDRTCTSSACGGGVVTSCACAEVAPGQGDSIPLAGEIIKLVAHPSRCLLYALAAGATPELVIIDAAGKKELRRVPLPEAPTDLDISPNGSYIVVGHPSSISIIDPVNGDVALTLATVDDVFSVEISDEGVAYYARFYGFPAVRRFDLRTGVDLPFVYVPTSVDLELSDDGTHLYAGESNSSGAKLVKYDLTRSPPVEVDRSTYRDGYGFPYPERHVLVLPGQRRAYYAGHQLDADALRFVRGRLDERILAADRRGTYAVGTRHVFDADLTRPIAEVPHGAALAALVASEQELWYYSADTVRVYFVNPHELLAGQTLGVREVAPEPLASYQLTELLHDPVRPRLYGLDTSRDAVVVLDAATLAPLRELRVGSTPTDLDIDPLGATLFVGHLDVLGFARIDLASLTFERFAVSPRNTFRLIALGANRVVTNDDDQWTYATLSDATSGAALDQRRGYQSTLAVSADRQTLFVGDSGISTSSVSRYAIENDRLTPAAQAYGLPYSPTRTSAALPDASGLYYAGALRDGMDLSVARYESAEPILAVTPNGALALSATGIYAVASGARVGDLGATATAIAISPDGARGFFVAGRQIHTIDLNPFALAAASPDSASAPGAGHDTLRQRRR